MEKINGEEIKKKILEIIKIRGPSLPIHISKEIKLNTIFSSAFLSELISEKKLKISNLKVGGSPLYFLPGQEKQLEKFSDFLNGKEKEAFLILKERKILRDSELAPAIRVALKNLKDFAVQLYINGENFWCYSLLSEEEKRKLIEQIEKEKEKREIEIKPQKEIEEIKIAKEIVKLPQQKKEKTKKEKEESDFIKKVKEKLIKADIEIIEELYKSKREIYLIVRVDSKIGKIKFYCVAKDKKNISEKDLAVSLQKAQELRYPLLFLSDGELNKKAIKYLEEWKNIIKFKKIKDLEELYT